MRQHRSAQAGVTLIEMLVALAVSAMIGLAGLILLESVTRTEAGVTGRLEQIKLQDRAFHILARDVEQAHRASFGTELELHVASQIITWKASKAGLIRRITSADRPMMEQLVLDDAATLSSPDGDTIMLTLPEADIWRQMALHAGHRP
ncbi:prepilin-type N-terminal cleavage/methylation domain-containing protein [uncultured Tateyamaria sp.]|uniref:PulJ/GspJ family protein n=1 Tax=uncultured Tateyamaria sp. TaxID=455651 RepID=UPI00261E2661|nr:prepilin-type N-terminal cleavage/methylation domain-containing protein [uncultured Tateyamaria sp.]